MPFILKVTAGAGEGAEFSFDQAEAKLGRTADNDIVVKDAAASRSHCRVFEKGGRYFVEDLKSANGTKYNGALITAPRPLSEGDGITIGDVTFTFALPVPPVGDSTLLKPPAEEFDPNATMLKSPLREPPKPDVQRERRTVKKMEAAVDPDDDGGLSDRTDERPALSEKTDERTGLDSGPTDARALARVDDSTQAFEVPPPASLRAIAAKAVDEGLTVPPARSPLKRRSGKDESAVEVELSAAERSRRKREAQSSALGRLRFAFSELPKRTRTGVLVAFGLFSAVLLGLLVMVAVPSGASQQDKSAEPQELVPMAGPLEASFGLGNDVTFERADQKIFSIVTASPTKVVAILHYQAKDISKDEVSVALNGNELGFVPADTMDVASRELELLFPPTVMKPRDVNQLVIDNVKNPPGEEPWRVWNLWVEVVPIPELSPAETIREALQNKERADKLLELRDVGPDNLFRAWKTFREAWLQLESIPAGRDETLYTYVRIKIKELQPQLDNRCNQMMLEVQKALNAKRPDRRKARQTLEDVVRYFPTREHRCYSQSRAFLEDLGG